MRLVTWVLALVIGAVYAIAGTIAHAYRVGWFPLGILLAIVGSAALLIAVRALTADRWTALAAGVGMVAAVFLFSGRGPGGSVIVPGGELDRLGPVSLGLVWAIAVPVLVVLVVVWPERGRHRVTAAEDDDESRTRLST